MGQAGAGAPKLSGEEPGEPRTRGKAEREGDVPGIGRGSCPSPRALLPLSHTWTCPPASPRPAALPGLGRRCAGRTDAAAWPHSAPSAGLGAARTRCRCRGGGAQRGCVPRHWARNVLTFRGTRASCLRHRPRRAPAPADACEAEAAGRRPGSRAVQGTRRPRQPWAASGGACRGHGGGRTRLADSAGGKKRGPGCCRSARDQARMTASRTTRSWGSGSFGDKAPPSPGRAACAGFSSRKVAIPQSRPPLGKLQQCDSQGPGWWHSGSRALRCGRAREARRSRAKRPRAAGSPRVKEAGSEDVTRS